MYRYLVLAALVATAYPQCLLTRTNVAPQVAGSCTTLGATAPCQAACASDFIGVQFGTLTSYQCGIGLYSYACTCVYSSKKYTTTCPTAHTDQTPCVNMMPVNWCSSTTTNMCSYSPSSAIICYDTCFCGTTGK